jgi:hypothetical protein
MSLATKGSRRDSRRKGRAPDRSHPIRPRDLGENAERCFATEEVLPKGVGTSDPPARLRKTLDGDCKQSSVKLLRCLRVPVHQQRDWRGGTVQKHVDEEAPIGGDVVLPTQPTL